MLTRAYDNTTQGIDRVVRSILSWEACEKAAKWLSEPVQPDLFGGAA